MAVSKEERYGSDPLANLEARPGLPFHPLTAAKLHDRDCGFSFRVNNTALHFNVPVYRWIEERFGISRPQFVVLYSLRLIPGSTAHDICVSSGFPRNTISRSVAKVLKLKMISRRNSREDRRKQMLYLTRRGEMLLAEAIPYFVAREKVMLGSLSQEERKALNVILAKLVAQSASWPVELAGAEHSLSKL